MGKGKRLGYYIEKQGFKKKEFCEKYGFEYNGFVQIIAEKRPIGINILDKVHVSLPKLNMHWLLYGEGSEELNDEDQNILSEPTEMYARENDVFEFLLLKYLSNKNIKMKVYEIVKEIEKSKV